MSGTTKVCGRGRHTVYNFSMCMCKCAHALASVGWGRQRGLVE